MKRTRPSSVSGRNEIHPEDRQRVRTDWRAAIKDSSTFDSELRIRRADGVYRWFRARSIPIRDPRGSILKWYGTSTDVDERKRETARPG